MAAETIPYAHPCKGSVHIKAPPHPTSHPNQVVRNKNGLHCGKTDQERLLRHFRHVAQPPTPLTAACHRWGCDHLHPCPSMSNGTSTIVRLVDCRMTAETILASAANIFAIPAAGRFVQQDQRRPHRPCGASFHDHDGAFVVRRGATHHRRQWRQRGEQRREKTSSSRRRRDGRRRSVAAAEEAACWPVIIVITGLRLRSPLPSTNSPNQLTLPPSLRGDVQIYTAPRPYEGMRR